LSQALATTEEIVMTKQQGFSLVEMIIAIGIITIGVLSLAATLGYSIITSNRIKQVTLAKYIAVTTMETIISARESQVLAFTSIAPQSGSNPNGFATGIQPVKEAGTDRIFGTADDAGDLVYIIGPNTTNLQFDGATDEKINLTQIGYRREITIVDINDPATGRPLGLKRIEIQVYYPSPVGGQKSYVMTTVLGDYRVGNPS
jgi:prepilin-type N-terminal cleavage/methylation domain-containing protein